MTNAPLALMSIGSPIVDTMVMIDENFLQRYVGGEKGGMRLISQEAMANLLRQLPQDHISTIGGSAMNTARALARLGVRTAGLGKIGDDANAEFYQRKIQIAGMDNHFKIAVGKPTAQCLALVTPDAARTLRTNLGAAAAFSPADICAANFAEVDYVYIEGYILPNIELAERIFQLAQDADCTVCVNLGSFEIVRALHEKMHAWFKDYVSMVFGNIEEAREFFREPNGTPKQLAQSLMSICGFTAITDGANGAVIAESGHETIEVPAVPAPELIDTTGAGDFWTAGFLYGKITNQDSVACGKIASRMAQEVIAVTGVELPDEKWNALRREFSEWQK